MRGAWLGVGVLGLLTSGCEVTRTFVQADGGSDGTGGGATTASTTTTSGVGGTGGGPPSCGDGLVCVPETPTGWQGPFVQYEGAGTVGTPFCPTAYAQALGDYFADLDPGIADCGCSCGDATPVTCGSTAYICNVANCNVAPFCNNLNYTTTITAGTNCAASNPGAYVAVGGGGVIDPGSCAAASNPSIAQPTWGTAAKVCGGATSTTVGCDAGQICVPGTDATFDKLCIAQPGDVACADAFYATKHLVYEDYTDTRSCTACGCGPATSTCTGSVAYAYNGCMLGVTSIPLGGCGPVDAIASEAGFAQPVGSGSCAPTGGVVNGEAAPTGALTLCCNG